MNAYESLTEEACKDGIDILERNFNSQRIHGLYCDGTVAVNKSIPTTAKTCVSYDCRRYNRHVRSQEPKTGTAGTALGI